MCMQTNSKLIIKINDRIEENIRYFDSFDHIYIFGSILNSECIPNDIDILLIYREYSEKVIKDFDSICTCFIQLDGLYVDFTVLSNLEEQESKFLERLSGKYLKIK